ncbi:MAG: hypothetical protein GTO08_07850 [Deltaproteobacteria bacterium]|nr:hypothetical protein [Deltaproteobacteria bacterium]
MAGKKTDKDIQNEVGDVEIPDFPSTPQVKRLTGSRCARLDGRRFKG